ncbi:hypothetical protein SLS55_007375 [Diplodia seriata]|uniref:Uncharacterized protein n=1 Tax=Diplodia seriata TaxID=420778 RepID=A0ABR3CC63_9PEZI
MSRSTPTRQWFQPGEGIAREVITADIQRYLGPDALVKPGIGTGEYEGVEGYWITAYRTLTSQMVQDLKLDSQRWRAEVQQGRVPMEEETTPMPSPSQDMPNKEPTMCQHLDMDKAK